MVEHARLAYAYRTILSDELNYVSMIEGIPHSRAEAHAFAPSDPRDLERKLADLDQHAPKLVAFESVYSMDGGIADREGLSHGLTVIECTPA